MRPGFYLLLLICLVTSTLKAQQIPPAVNKWLSTELEKGRNKKLLKDYTSDAFFSKDSGRIVGYIKGYDTTLKFTSGVIYMENIVTREDYPTVVPVHPDGRFEVGLKMMHPQWLMILFDRKYWLPVYIEPGQVVSMVFDWQLLAKKGDGDTEFKRSVLFGGPAAQINRELSSIDLDKPDYDVLNKQVKTLTPDAFKVATQTHWDKARKKLELQLSGKKYQEHTKTILRNEIDLYFAIILLDYIMNRDYQRAKDTANKVLAITESIEFYDFLVKNNFDRQELFLSNNFSTFVNRLEFSKPYRESISIRVKKDPDTEMAKFSPQIVSLLRPWQIADTLLPNKYGITTGFLFELCKARSLKQLFGNAHLFRDKKDDARIYLTALSNGMNHPFLLRETEELFQRSYSSTGKTYTLPDNRSAAIFKSIIDRHKGKLLFVDFWATTCGPCIANIKAQKELRSKYRNNPDFDFIFITSENESPEKAYEKFIAEQHLTNTYRINADNYLALRELFKFNGIPRYVLIDKEGKVLDDDFEMYNFQFELSKLFPGKQWK
ncbi:TlpA disulfide reductase family protein [Chitinophaga niabensis]|uniref:TlpA family protein disulfide reductase n=1 Tax=Chitinophaga niabensis TaxID=536979 RepID=UPI0031B9C2F7